MGVAAAHQEALGKGDGMERTATGKILAGSQNDGAAKGVFDSYASRTSEYVLPSWQRIFAERLISRILEEEASKVGFGTEIARGRAAVYGGVVALGSFERVVALVANVGETRRAHACGLGEERDLILSHYNVGGFYQAIGEAVNH